MEDKKIRPMNSSTISFDLRTLKKAHCCKCQNKLRRVFLKHTNLYEHDLFYRSRDEHTLCYYCEHCGYYIEYKHQKRISNDIKNQTFGENLDDLINYYKIIFIEKLGKQYTLVKEIEAHNAKRSNLKFSIILSIFGVLIGYIPVYLTKFNNEYLYFLSIILSLFLSMKFYELGNAPNKKYRPFTIIPLVTLAALFVGAIFYNYQNFNGNLSLYQILFSKEYRIYLLEGKQPLLNKTIKAESTTVQSASL
jgi:hypothetical protein